MLMNYLTIMNKKVMRYEHILKQDSIPSGKPMCLNFLFYHLTFLFPRFNLCATVCKNYFKRNTLCKALRSAQINYKSLVSSQVSDRYISLDSVISHTTMKTIFVIREHNFNCVLYVLFIFFFSFTFNMIDS